MKLSTILSIVAFVSLGSTAYGQITLNEKNAPIEKVLSVIEKQTKYVFLYDPAELAVSPITINVKNATLQQTLDLCFKDQPITFTLVGDNVLLKRASQSPAPTTETSIHGRITDESGQPLFIPDDGDRNLAGVSGDIVADFLESFVGSDVVPALPED